MPHGLSAPIRQGVENYLESINDESCCDLYHCVINQVERDLLEIALQKTAGNQIKAAKMLGISRNTLRRKMQQFGFI